MKQTLALLLTVFTLSFAACTKSDNNTFMPAPGVNPGNSNVAYFKGDMHDDKLTVTSFDGNTISIIYKGRFFTGTALRGNETYSITVTDGHTTATGKIQVMIYYYNGSVYTSYTPAYIQIDRGNIFESQYYTLITQ